MIFYFPPSNKGTMAQEHCISWGSGKEKPTHLKKEVRPSKILKMFTLITSRMNQAVLMKHMAASQST